MSILAMTADGDYDIPESAIDIVLSLRGTFGTASVSIGYYTDPDNQAGFEAFADLDAQTAAFDKVVTKGQGVKCLARVATAGGTSLTLLHAPA